ncbi:MAG: SusC/RagA family TonB-linked outer membrane protein, partial [Flavobacteriaceae bacterium]|nr:SusC/RagA family TonB-linked outer membrane protein [Flavobacteriaceae bacterium]
AYAQSGQGTIKGKMIDKESGEPLPFANIVVMKGGSQVAGAQTDFDGNYSIQASPGQVLKFSFLGFADKNITVGASNTVNVTLAESAADIGEVVITGYSGILKDSDVVSAVSTVKAESIEQVPIASVDQFLQGNVAGANFRVSSGQPGQSGTIIIRGRNSINGDIEPLFIIDGMPVNQDNFRSLNANDIESMSVLKDAAATAIYGNRGAGGVVLITTKRAKRNSGVVVQYRGLYGVSRRPNSNLDMMNSNQILRFQREIGALDPVVFPNGLTDAEIDAISAQTNTDWKEVLLREGTTESHEINIRSGGEKLTSYNSFQYFEQEGITLRSKLQRFSVRNNMDGNFGKFNFSSSFSMNYSESDFVIDRIRDANTGGQLDNPFIVPFVGLPFISPFRADGGLELFGTFRSRGRTATGALGTPNDLNGFRNTPFIALNTAALNTDKEREFRLTGSFNGSYNLIKNVTVGGMVGTDYINIERLFIDAPGSIRGLITPTEAAATDVAGGSQFEAFSRDFSFNTNAYIRYDNTFAEKHRVSVAGYTEYFYRNIQGASFQAFGLNPKFPGSSAGFTDGSTRVFTDPDNPTLANLNLPFVPGVSSTEAENVLLSYFGNATYDYDGRYGLDVTFRRDGTSRFSRSQRWGNFWSVGARWNIDREAFMEDVDWVTSLKLRGSYGENGNQNLPGFFPGFQTVAGSPGFQNQNQLFFPNLADEGIQWETTEQVNIGIDFGLFQNRLTGAIDVYDKTTDDLFFGSAISAAGTGFTTTTTNIAEMSNKGVEVQLSYDVLRKSETNPWSVTVFGNFAYNKNEIEKIGNDQGFVEAGSGTRLQEGLPAFTFFLQRWAGVDPSTGQPLYLDAEGNLTNVLDRAAEGVYLDKQFDPVYTGGFGWDVSYKGFTFNTLWSYAADTYRLNQTLALVEDADLAGLLNQSVTQLTAWKNPGDITAIPSVDFQAGLRIPSSNQSTRTLEDASFLRLRNATLAYNFDRKVLEDLGFFSAIRVYVQGTNLFTFSEWRGFDPESTLITEFFDFPTPRTYSMGVDITF